MDKSSALSSLTLSLMLLLIISRGEARIVVPRTWCIAKAGASDAQLQSNIDFVCSKFDCSIISPGGSCYEPNIPVHHASVVMNIWYQQSGRRPGSCDFGGTGLIANTNPSSGSCRFVGLAIASIQG